MDCHFPIISCESWTGTDSDAPNSIAIRWEWALIGSCALQASFPPGQPGGPSRRCRSLCKYGSDWGRKIGWAKETLREKERERDGEREMGGEERERVSAREVEGGWERYREWQREADR